MGILASTRHTPQPPGRWVMVPKDMASPKRRRERVMFRRRRIFARLLLLAGVTLVLGLIPPLRVVLMAHLGVDLALVVYVFQLRRWRKAELERALVVHELAPEGVDDIPPDEAAFRSG
jgi:hypothetical protein